MRSRGVLLAAASVLLGGCTMLHSSSDPSYGGIAYYLPKSLVVAKVDLWIREEIPVDPTQGRPEPNPRYLVAIDIKKDNDTQTEFPTRGVIVPDLSERYTLAYSSNPFFHDRYCVETGESSLLKSIEYATKDETPQIVLALAELGRKVGAFVSDRPAGIPEGQQRPDASVSVTFDPFDRNDTAAAARAINKAFNKLVNVRFEFPDLSHFRRNDAHGKCRGGGGICFRTVAKTPMRLKDLNSGYSTTSVLVDVVNPNYTGHMDLDRAFMVEKVHRLGFKDGALTQVIMRKPSEALQTVKLPIAVVDAILAIPSNFIAKAAGNTQDVQAELTAMGTTLTTIETQLAAGVAAGGNAYRESCNGGVLRGG